MILWLTFLVNFSVAVGFTVFGALRAKHIGGLGPWLVVAVGAIDAFLLLAYRVLFGDLLHLGTRDILVALEGFDTLLTMSSVLLILVGFGAMMPKTVRAR